MLASDQPVIVDFWAEWCPPCKLLSPVIDDLAEEYKGRVKIGKVDTDSNRNTAMRFSISAIPTVLVFKKGQLVQRLQGFRPKKDFKSVLDGLLAGSRGLNSVEFNTQSLDRPSAKNRGPVFYVCFPPTRQLPRPVDLSLPGWYITLRWRGGSMVYCPSPLFRARWWSFPQQKERPW